VYILAGKGTQTKQTQGHTGAVRVSQSNAHQPSTDQSLTFLLSQLYHPSLGNHQLILTSDPHPQCYDLDSAWGCSTKQPYISSDAVGTPQLDL